MHADAAPLAEDDVVALLAVQVTAHDTRGVGVVVAVIEDVLDAMRSARLEGDPYHFVVLDCRLHEGDAIAISQAVVAVTVTRGPLGT